MLLGFGEPVLFAGCPSKRVLGKGVAPLLEALQPNPCKGATSLRPGAGGEGVIRDTEQRPWRMVAAEPWASVDVSCGGSCRVLCSPGDNLVTSAAAWGSPVVLPWSFAGGAAPASSPWL